MTRPDAAIRFMTFNIRFDTIQDEAAGNRWPQRAGSVIDTITACDPDIIGFQEALRSQMNDLMAAFPAYRALGKPREIGDKGEYVPLFVRADRFALDEHGDFWLSTTPEVEGSRSWDSDAPRHCTWARLTEQRSGARFVVFNTHLDRWGVMARVEAARLIIGRLAVAPAMPTVVMGDLNAGEDSEPLEVLRGSGLRDTFRVVHPDATDVQTVHHYADLTGDQKIDYILSDARWEVLDASIVRARAAGRLPSDHYPLIADLLPRGDGLL